MVTLRHMNVLRSVNIGISPDDVSQWTSMLKEASACGVLRVGDYNIKMLDSMLQAWNAERFMLYPVYEYTYGERTMPWLEEVEFKEKAAVAHTILKLPYGYPLKATYKNGQVESVCALTIPGEYDRDVTDVFMALFPAGVSPKVKSIYAILSVVKSNWVKEIWRLGSILNEDIGFLHHMDMLTLVAVEGCTLDQFCDDGILGALVLPEMYELTSKTEFEEICKSIIKTQCTLIALGDFGCCALYCSGVNIGEVLSMRVCAGHGSTDVVYLDLDTEDVVCVTDLLALQGVEEGTEVYYVKNKKGDFVLSDEYGNELLGSCIL